MIGSQVTVEDGSHIVLLAADRPATPISAVSSPTAACAAPRARVASRGARSVSMRQGMIACGAATAASSRAHRSALRGTRTSSDAFGDRLYAMVTRHRRAEERRGRRQRVRDRATRYGIPTVAATEVLYHTRARRDLQDVLTCIRHGDRTLSTAGRLTRPNAEHAFKSPYAFRVAFERRSRVGRAHRGIAERCTFSLAEIRYRYPSEKLPDGTSVVAVAAPAHLRRRRRTLPARSRYPRRHPAEDVRAQLEKELGSDRRARLRRLLPHHVRDRAVLPRARTSSARGAARRRTRRCATASASPRSTRCGWTCCSSASSRRSAPSRPTSTSTSSTSAARK